MIKLLNNTEILNSFTDICGVKLQTLAISYGLDKSFCTFWAQENENSEIIAVIGKFCSAVTVSAKQCDEKELVEFIKCIGFSELICPSALARYFEGFSEQYINCVEKAVYPSDRVPENFSLDDYLKMYSILTESSNEAIRIGKFDDWYVDISHRIRHKGAAAVLSEYGCGICLLSKDATIINGIAVSEKDRGKGWGKEILLNLENIGNSKISMAFCLDSELPFYLTCGYKLKEKYSLISKGQ